MQVHNKEIITEFTLQILVQFDKTSFNR